MAALWVTREEVAEAHKRMEHGRGELAEYVNRPVSSGVDVERHKRLADSLKVSAPTNTGALFSNCGSQSSWSVHNAFQERIALIGLISSLAKREPPRRVTLRASASHEELAIAVLFESVSVLDDAVN
jgi:hypothetical protein